MKTFDDLLKDIGEFGWYQKRLYGLVCLPAFTVSGLLVLNVFILGVPEHRCKLPGYENDTYDIQSDLHAQLINQTIPPSETEGHTYDRCHYRNHVGNSTRTEACSDWVYDTSVFKSTFAKKLDMVCDDAIKIPNAQMVFFFGVLTGSIFYGQLSDIIGRQKTMYMCVLVLLGSANGLVGMVEYVGFCILLFLVGGATLGLYMTLYVMGMELVGPSKRIWTGNIIQIILTNGVMYLILMVYLLREWHYFTLAVSVPITLFLPYYWLIPESCRWLLSKGREKEALKILKKVALNNKTTLNEKDIEELPPLPPEGRVWQLFTRKRLAIRTLAIFFNWFVCSMSYYGVVLNTSNLGGSLYLNFVLLTAVEYPAKIFCMMLMDRLGRKKLFIGYMIVGGVALVATIGPILDGNDKLHALLIGLAMVGKLCITGAFSVVYVHSAEMFPTVVRNAGMGSSSAVARVGSMVAPYIAKAGDLVGGTTGKCLPLTLFGGAMFVSGIVTTMLPETLNRQLPDSIDNANDMRRKERKPMDVYAVNTGESVSAKSPANDKQVDNERL